MTGFNSLFNGDSGECECSGENFIQNFDKNGCECAEDYFLTSAGECEICKIGTGGAYISNDECLCPAGFVGLADLNAAGECECNSGYQTQGLSVT